MLEKIKIGNKSLNMIIANKGYVHKKERIGFMSNTQQKPTIFVKWPTLHISPREKYNFYKKI